MGPRSIIIQIIRGISILIGSIFIKNWFNIHKIWFNLHLSLNIHNNSLNIHNFNQTDLKQNETTTYTGSQT